MSEINPLAGMEGMVEEPVITPTPPQPASSPEQPKLQLVEPEKKEPPDQVLPKQAMDVLAAEGYEQSQEGFNQYLRDMRGITAEIRRLEQEKARQEAEKQAATAEGKLESYLVSNVTEEEFYQNPKKAMAKALKNLAGLQAEATRNIVQTQLSERDRDAAAAEQYFREKPHMRELAPKIYETAQKTGMPGSVIAQIMEGMVNELPRQPRTAGGTNYEMGSQTPSGGPDPTRQQALKEFEALVKNPNASVEDMDRVLAETLRWG